MDNNTMSDELRAPQVLMKQRQTYSRLRRHFNVFAIISLFSAICLLLYYHSRRSSSLPLPPDGTPAVGFDLTESYGTVSTRDSSGSILHVARIDGDAKYQSTMQRLSMASSRHTVPPYEWFHDGGAVNWEGNLRQQRRRLRKSLGLPASADVGIIAKLLSSLRAAAEEAQQRQITHAMIATPDLVALYDEDIADAAAHIGLALLSDSYYERQPKHVYAAFVAYGLNNHTLPSVPEKELRATGTRNVLTVYFSRGALGVEIASKWTNRTCLLTWAQHRSYFSTELGLPGFRLQGPWKKRVAALVQEAMYHELFQHHLDTGVTDVLLLGETADEEMLGQTVQDAVMEVQEREPVMHRAGREAMAFVGSRGAAEMAWAVMNGPLARAASAEECDAEQRRKQDTGGIPYYPPAAKEQDVDDLPDVYCGGVW